MIDLDATQGGAPGEGKGGVAAPPFRPRRRCRVRRCPSCVRPAPAPQRQRRGRPDARPPPKRGDDDDENALSLSALEEKLKPQVLRTLKRIAKVYVEMSKMQKRRLSTLSRGQKPSAEFEKSYEKTARRSSSWCAPCTSTPTASSS